MEGTSPDRLRGRILVVDDEPMVLGMLAETLRMESHTVVTSVDAETALIEVERQEFDLVLSDLHLPGLSGMDLLERIKARDPMLRVIVVTGQPALDKAIDAMKKGAVDFITKPFSIEHIHHIVQKNLQERSLVQENQRLLAELNNKAVIEQLNRTLHQKVDQITKLYKISDSLHSVTDNQALFQHVVDLASELTEAQRISLLTFDPKRKFMTIRASKGISTEVQREVCMKASEGIAGRVAKSHRPLRVTSKEIRAFDTTSAHAYGSESWLSVPLFIGGELFAVLNLTDKQDRSDFTESDEHVAMTLAEKVGGKIENNALYEGIYANLLDTLKALVSSIEAKDAYTRHHSQRVTTTALALAQRVGCNKEDCESIAFAGILHDIGKIGIRDSILLKTSRLTQEEYETIKQHPVIGNRIVEPLGLIDAERDIILHHHERYDGKGYPDGLRGEEIPLLSRIVSLADSFDAMTSTRSYRRALPMEVVLEEMRKNAGTQFDAGLVDVMMEALEEGDVEPYGDDSEEDDESPVVEKASGAIETV